jgi:hypothetical protein
VQKPSSRPGKPGGETRMRVNAVVEKTFQIVGQN